MVVSIVSDDHGVVPQLAVRSDQSRYMHVEPRALHGDVSQVPLVLLSHLPDTVEA